MQASILGTNHADLNGLSSGACYQSVIGADGFKFGVDVVPLYIKL